MRTQRILVVGGLSGIGQAVVSAAGAERCIVWSRRTGVDATDPAAVHRAVGALLHEGPPWAWVHAMGEFDERAATATDPGFLRTMVDSNLTSAFLLQRELAPAMAAAGGGRIVFFGAAGLEGRAAFGRAPAYFAAKAGLLVLTRALALELAPRGVTVNMISPGIIQHDSSHAASQSRMVGRVPLGRAGEVSDVVGAVQFLLSADSAYVTGTNLEVDGGLALV